jgi:hypothetical protein
MNDKLQREISGLTGWLRCAVCVALCMTVLVGKLPEDGHHTRPKHVGGKHLHRLGCKDILIHSNKCIYKYSAFSCK